MRRSWSSGRRRICEEQRRCILAVRCAELFDNMAQKTVTDQDLLETIKRWRDQILQEAHIKIDMHCPHTPSEEFSDETRGFERGLYTALREIRNLGSDELRKRYQ